MRDTRLRRLLAIDYPILQAGVPWVSNPELVAAVSNAGGLGVLHPSAGMAPDGDMAGNLRESIRATRRLTAAPFGVCFYLANPQAEELIDVALQEGARIAVTYGGSPALFTGKLKGEDAVVLHQVSTVRHARGAEAQGVDVVIADGYEGGGIRGPEEIPNLVLVPQIAEAVSIPIIVSGGVMDARGFVAAMALGAHGVQLGTRFVATHECIAHPKYKEALLGGHRHGHRRSRPVPLADSAPAERQEHPVQEHRAAPGPGQAGVLGRRAGGDPDTRGHSRRQPGEQRGLLRRGSRPGLGDNERRRGGREPGLGVTNGHSRPPLADPPGARGPGHPLVPRYSGASSSSADTSSSAMPRTLFRRSASISRPSRYRRRASMGVSPSATAAGILVLRSWSTSRVIAAT